MAKRSKASEYKVSAFELPSSSKHKNLRCAFDNVFTVYYIISQKCILPKNQHSHIFCILKPPRRKAEKHTYCNKEDYRAIECYSRNIVPKKELVKDPYVERVPKNPSSFATSYYGEKDEKADSKGRQLNKKRGKFPLFSWSKRMKKGCHQSDNYQSNGRGIEKVRHSFRLRFERIRKSLQKEPIFC